MSISKTQCKNLHTLQQEYIRRTSYMESGLDFYNVEEMTTSDMPTGQFSSLSAKFLSCYEQVDFRLVCQIETLCQIFSMIQLRIPAHDALLSPSSVACKQGIV